MLPPDLAAFAFSLDVAGGDEALATRAAAAVAAAPGASRLAVVGAQRWGLLAALSRALDGTAVEIAAFDPSRTALATVRRALEFAGVADRVSLYAADPRDLDIPEGADAALVPSNAWRTIVHREGRASALASLRRALRPDGRLFLDLDRVPGGAPAAFAPLREGPGRQRWSWKVASASGIATVRCESPGVAPLEIDVAVFSPEEAIDEVRAAGFRTESSLDAATGGPLDPASARLWLVARAGDRPA